MKFKELREANLSKAQINKVHDKADKMPKSDFIKRYGKEGDAVRFATATNQVKKELGLEGYSSGPGTSRGRGGLRSVPTSRVDTIPIDLPLKGEKPGGLVPGTVKQKLLNLEVLDKEDEKSVGRVVKGLKKAVKAHQGQVDALTKDIKDETELDEVDAPVARAKTALDVAVAKKSVKAAAAVKQKTKDKADVQRLLDRQKRLRAVARRNEEVVTNEGGPGSGPQKSYKTIPKNETESERDTRLDKANIVMRVANDKRISDALKKMQKQDEKQKKKDKADTQRLLDRQKRQGLQKIGRRNEEVVTEAVSAALVNQISRMTDRNNHFGVRIELARIAGDKELMRYYDSLEKMHNKLGGVIGNSAIEVRQKLESVLKNRLQRKFNDKDADRLMDAL